MINTPAFSLNRFLKLTKIDFYSNFNQILLWGSSICGIIILILLLNQNIFAITHYLLLNFILFFGGFIFSSSIFNNLKEQTSGIHWILLPASSLEKYILKVLYATVFYVIFIFIIYTLAANTAIFSINYLWHRQNTYFNPFHFSFFKSIKIYIAVSSFYIYGSLFFKNKNYVKTTSLLFVISILIGFISAFFFKIFMSEWFNGLTMKPEIIDMIFASHKLGYYFKEMIAYQNYSDWIFNVFLLYVTPIWMLVTGYFRLTETEI